MSMHINRQNQLCFESYFHSILNTSLSNQTNL
uniref:Uncharacterized protein n=1 Tax=Rhizophora mucronata TaxID=61149 RepID=A0A2P2PJ78_RHIMU